MKYANRSIRYEPRTRTSKSARYCSLPNRQSKTNTRMSGKNRLRAAKSNTTKREAMRDAARLTLTIYQYIEMLKKAPFFVRWWAKYKKLI